ncbi:NfeD family protein [Catellatospora sichuanensis]|uniref:NfeD family protein n=1 Tax=Catellatospora sichuanensis TaxID=1969805 RepID=UPI001C8FB350|nr:nodulation protein NfeD [Catellatospora sichuanensis]
MTWVLRVWALLAVAFAVAVGAQPAAGQTPVVLVTRVEGVITPVIADHVGDAVAAAVDRGSEALLVELDTPGGLDPAMRAIVRDLLSARVPVIVYVEPSGARAASAGAIITMAAHVAAMAPGTTIGAATPVNAQTGEPAGDKIINDFAAYAQSIAGLRGRDQQFAADAVRQGKAVPAQQAEQLGVIDLIAANRAELLQAIDGRPVTLADGSTVTLATAAATTSDYDISGARRLLQILADPNLAFLFLSIGTLAVVYELATPGMGLGGVIGVILLVLGFVGLSVLPVNVAGLVLLALAAGLFLAEVLTPGVGVFAAGGAISLALAGLLLFEDPARVNPAVFLPTAVLVGAGSIVAGRIAWRARSSPPLSGTAALTGRPATVAASQGTTGTAFVDGAWWQLRAGVPLTAGQTVRVTGADGLTLLVEPDGTPPGEGG